MGVPARWAGPARWLGAAGLLAALATACTGGAPEVARTPPPPSTSPGTAEATGTGESTAEALARLRQRVTPPALPSFTVPTDVLTGAEDRRVAERLQVPPGLYRGIAVLDARCDDAGGARAADAGRPLTGPEGRASARDGDVRVTVGGDGTGVYDAPGLHVAVLAGGAGVYDDGTARLAVQADGSGTWTAGGVRSFVRADGSGTFRDPAVRLWVDPGGAGGYDGPEGRVTVDAAGGTGGDADPAFAAAVAQLVAEGLPRFPPAPPVVRVAPAGRTCGTVVRLDAGVLFALDSAGVREDGAALLDRVAGLLRELGSPAVDVVGHTDASGTEEHNQVLSERRAAAVADHLAALGVPRASLHPGGRGEREPLRPAADGAPDPAAAQRDRRVELVLREPVG
ncbi:OmpA family protein [Kineococcus glutinatus]|uniref:OmpA-like domain-containing protein n=1 Tax=Kineococcus glutinatus TaxID=1070872 RepID=A0ABP9HTH3_9ACTN